VWTSSVFTMPNGGARCSGSRWTNAWTDPTTSHSFYCGEESDGGLPAGASCDALDVVSRAPASVAAAPEAGFDVLQLAMCLVSVGPAVAHAQRRLDEPVNGSGGDIQPKVRACPSKAPVVFPRAAQRPAGGASCHGGHVTAARLRAHRLPALVRTTTFVASDATPSFIGMSPSSRTLTRPRRQLFPSQRRMSGAVAGAISIVTEVWPPCPTRWLHRRPHRR
jgi:hypothetical protein